jgi:predicted TIM-barrel fold metal-dependent hydrolase
LDRYFALCAELHLPVCSHSGPGWGPLDFGYARPLLLDSAARRFPGVDFIFGHGAVFGTAECVAIAAHRPNVYLESSGFSSAPNADGWPAHLNTTFRLGVQHKMIFGTGWPSYRLTESMASLCAAVVDGDEVFNDVSDAARALILGGNARRLLTQADR